MEAAQFPWPALGVLLIRDGLVNRSELEDVLALQGDGRDQRISGQRLGEVLVERGIVTSAQVARLVAEQHELPFVDLDESDAIVPVTANLPEEGARRCMALPIRMFPDGSLLVVVADPTRHGCFDDVRSALGVPIRFAVAAGDAVAAAIEMAFSNVAVVQHQEAGTAATLVEAADQERPEEPRESTDESFAPAEVEEPWPVLGSLLLRDGLVTEDELDAALAQQRLSSTRRLGEILIARGVLTDRQVSRMLAEQHELPFVDLDDREIDPAAVSTLPAGLAHRHCALPIAYQPDGSLLVVVADPTSVLYEEELRAVLETPLHFAVAVPEEIEAAIASFADVRPTLEPVEAQEAERDDIEAESALTTAAAPPSIALVAEAADDTVGDEDENENESRALETIRTALSGGASAVHIAPGREGVVVRARMHGTVEELETTPPGDGDVLKELGALLGLDLTREAQPQHGRRIEIPLEDRTVELRASILPTMLGTRVTLRVAGLEERVDSLHDLFAEESTYEALRSALEQPRGMLVICGSAGSGRTTTLTAALRHVNTPDRAVLTVEDPVEHAIDGIDQIEVDPHAGVTFATALRTMLRADPDIVAVGELLDPDTARAVVHGALAGTLVLTTVHGETAAAGAQRLRELGIEPGLLGAALTCLVAQQLVRRICPDCRETYYATDDDLGELELPSEEAGRRLLARGRGCDACNGTGYQGLVGVSEVLPLNRDVLAVIADWAPATDIQRAAVTAGMSTLREGAIRLCLEGVTTVGEVRSVAGERAAP